MSEISIYILNNRNEKGEYNVFNELKFKSYLCKGHLRDAVDYIGGVKEKEDLLHKYISVYEEGQYYKRTDNEIIGNIDKIYQNYYKDIFWHGVDNEREEKSPSSAVSLYILVGF